MRWPWQPDPKHVEALDSAVRKRDKVNARWADVHEQTDALDRRRQVNGFAQQIRAAMGVTE